jgi:hypothetical protein
MCLFSFPKLAFPDPDLLRDVITPSSWNRRAKALETKAE